MQRLTQGQGCMRRPCTMCLRTALCPLLLWWTLLLRFLSVISSICYSSPETGPVPSLYPQAHPFWVPRDFRAPEYWVVRTESHDFSTKPPLPPSPNPMRHLTRVSNSVGPSDSVNLLSEVLWGTPLVRQHCCPVTSTAHTFCISNFRAHPLFQWFPFFHFYLRVRNSFLNEYLLVFPEVKLCFQRSTLGTFGRHLVTITRSLGKISLWSWVSLRRHSIWIRR